MLVDESQNVRCLCNPPHGSGLAPAAQPSMLHRAILPGVSLALSSVVGSKISSGLPAAAAGLPSLVETALGTLSRSASDVS